MTDSLGDPPRVKMKKYPWDVYRFTMIVGCSTFAYGYTIGLMAAAILYIPDSIPLTVLETTFVVSTILVGVLVGTLGSGPLTDRLGRKPLLGSSCFLGMIASIICAFATASWYLILGRFLVGLAIGAIVVVSGLFLAETSPASIRGSLQGYGELAGWTGGILANLFGLVVIQYVPAQISWRIIFLSSGIYYGIASLITFFTLPESPRWLVLHGKREQAKELLRRIYGPDYEDELQEEYHHFDEMVQNNAMNQHATFMDLFKAEHRYAMTISISLLILQQLSGNNFITYYSSIILHDLGFEKKMAILMTTVSMVPQILIIWFIVHNLDTIGRKGPILISLAGAFLSLAILAGVMQIHPNDLCSWLSLVGILVNRIFFSIGIGPLPVVIAAEIMSSDIRGTGLAASLGIGSAIKIAAVIAFLPLTKAVHPTYLYGGLALAMAVGFVFMAMELQETKGILLDSRSTPIKVVSTTTTTTNTQTTKADNDQIQQQQQQQEIQ